MKLFNGFGVNQSRLIVSLCDYSGRWPSAYVLAGYSAALLDLKHGDDCLNVRETLHTLGMFPAHGVLMAPVCTDFSVSGAQYWKAKDADGRTAHSLALVDACLAIKDALKPTFWALENPVGRLKSLRPELPFIGWFQPHNYAALDDGASRYTKKTGLWGNATMPDKKPHNLDPVRACSQGSWIQTLGGKSERTKELRSMTPIGFANAFFLSNP